MKVREQGSDTGWENCQSKLRYQTSFHGGLSSSAEHPPQSYPTPKVKELSSLLKPLFEGCSRRILIPLVLLVCCKEMLRRNAMNADGNEASGHEVGEQSA